jgi:hypothetical protein
MKQREAFDKVTSIIEEMKRKARAAALEEAAMVCEAEARAWAPGSIGRGAAVRCAAAIRDAENNNKIGE